MRPSFEEPVLISASEQNFTNPDVVVNADSAQALLVQRPFL